MPSHDASEALFAALSTLRAGDRARAAGAWRAVDRYLSSKFPGARHEDVRQAALLSIHRGIERMEATDAAGAAAWVRTIFRRKRIDAARSERKGRALSLVGAEGAELEVESEGLVALSEGAIVELLGEIEAALDGVLEAAHPRAIDRILPRAHAQARLLRAMGHGVPEIRAELEARLPRASEVSDAAISKWIERGLPLLTQAIEAWRAQAPGEREGMAERLLERVASRRGDVGKPRISRRKSPGDEGVSVPGPARRRSRRRRWSMARWLEISARFAFARRMPGRSAPLCRSGPRGGRRR